VSDEGTTIDIVPADVPHGVLYTVSHTKGVLLAEYTVQLSLTKA
jgi:hypothetical protein